MAIHKVGVVGAGLMGAGIAQVSAQAGFPTVVREVSAPLLDKGMGAIFKFMQAGVDKGKVAPLDLDRVRENLRGTNELRDLAGCDLVIEAGPEKLDLKRARWGELGGACQAEASFASHTPRRSR